MIEVFFVVSNMHLKTLINKILFIIFITLYEK